MRPYPAMVFLMFVFAGLPANSTRGQVSGGVAWEIFCLPHCGANCPSWSGRCYCLRAGHRARPCIYTTQLILRVGNFNAEESCFFCSYQLRRLCIWPMGVHWSTHWVYHLRFKGMLGEGCFAPQNFKGVSGPLVWRPQCGVMVSGWRNCPCWCPNLKHCWGGGRAIFGRQP